MQTEHWRYVCADCGYQASESGERGSAQVAEHARSLFHVDGAGPRARPVAEFVLTALGVSIRKADPMTDKKEAEPCGCQLTICRGHESGDCSSGGRHLVQGAFYQPLWVCVPCAQAHETEDAVDDLEQVERSMARAAGQQEMFC